MPTKIDPKKIRTDLNTQIRVELSEETVAEYAELMERNTKFPPILVYYDGTIREYVLADGFHRLAAHLRVRPTEQIVAKVKGGTVDEARWASIGSNKDHGLRRTNADKHNAVTQALMHPSGTTMSDRKIADHAGVHHQMVGFIRRELETTGGIIQSNFRKGRDGRIIDTTKIGENPHENIHFCSECNYFEQKGTEIACQADSSRTEIVGITRACEDFMVRYEEPPPREVPPPDYENIEEYVPKPKKKSRHCQSQNRIDSIAVRLPLDNPGLFAVELRNNFPEEYLEICIEALNAILHDDETNDKILF